MDTNKLYKMPVRSTLFADSFPKEFEYWRALSENGILVRVNIPGGNLGVGMARNEIVRLARNAARLKEALGCVAE